MYEIGRLCLKIAGRDANKYCVVVDRLDDSMVLIDGQTRRKPCNVKHIEPTDKVLKLTKGASHDDVKKAFASLNLEIVDKKAKNGSEKPKKTKIVKKSKVVESSKQKVTKQ